MIKILYLSMAVSNALICAYITYEHKLGTESAETCLKLRATFGEGTIEECKRKLEMKTLNKKNIS